MRRQQQQQQRAAAGALTGPSDAASGNERVIRRRRDTRSSEDRCTGKKSGQSVCWCSGARHKAYSGPLSPRFRATIARAKKKKKRRRRRRRRREKKKKKKEQSYGEWGQRKHALLELRTRGHALGRRFAFALVSHGQRWFVPQLIKGPLSSFFFFFPPPGSK